MRRLLPYCMAFFLSSFIYSCKTAQGRLYKPEKLNKYESVIYIYRPYSRITSEGAIININSTLIKNLYNNGYLAVHAVPDLYKIKVAVGAFKDEISIRTKRNKIHFIRLKSYYKDGLHKFNFSTVKESVGKREIADKKLIRSLKHDEVCRVNPFTGKRYKAKQEPIHIIAEEGNVAVMKRELRSGKDLNLLDSLERSALMLASERGHLNMIGYLISRGADINLNTQGGNSALIMAANARQVGAVRYLIKKGAKVHNDIFFLRIRAAKEEDLYKQAVLFEKLAYLYGILGNRDKVIDYLEKYTVNIREMKRKVREDEKYAKKIDDEKFSAIDVLTVGIQIMKLFSR